MKKNLLFITALVMIVCTSSCKSSSSSSFESDVKKFANMRCKKQQLMAKDQSDEKIKKELEDVGKEMDAFSNEMEKKYDKNQDDKAMNEKADKIMKEVMAKCK